MTRSQAQPEQLLEPGTPDEQGIIRVDERRRLEAIERLVADGGRSSRAAAERFIAFSASNRIDIDAMWARLDGSGRIAATLLAVPNPGRTAVVFATPPTSEDAVVSHAALIARASRDLATMGVDLAQVLIEPNEELARRAYLAGGYSFLAQLSYLERPLSGLGRVPHPHWPTDVTVETYDPSRRSEMLAALQATYEQTLDCPGLRGLRRVDDILSGHEGTGCFDPDLWSVLRIDGAAVGVLMLNPSPANNTVELVYIGLAPPARGRGLGRQLLRHGLHRLEDRQERAMTLAVDDRNEPAIALYRGEGFRRIMRRCALIRSLRHVRTGAMHGPARDPDSTEGTTARDGG
jgi:ribosomal protein S18 acetylase RimI-like enzyme